MGEPAGDTAAPNPCALAGVCLTGQHSSAVETPSGLGGSGGKGTLGRKGNLHGLGGSRRMSPSIVPLLDISTGKSASLDPLPKAPVNWI